jgi:hypothetical protein
MRTSMDGSPSRPSPGRSPATAGRTSSRPSKKDRAARHHAAEQAAARRRQQARQRQRLIVAGGVVALVVLVLGVMVVVKVGSGGRTGATEHSPGAVTGVAPPELIRDVTGVPAAVLDTVGAGTVNAVPRPVTGQPALVSGGKPLVLYVGAEYCPFCAAQRWGMVVALSRFGTFSGLGVTYSASGDVYPNTATLSFHGSSYTSDYLTFEGVETQTNVRQGNGYGPLDRLTDQQTKILQTYDAAPYVDAASAGAIPFVDFGNRYVMVGAGLSPQLLAGLSATGIASALSDPTSTVAKAVDGSANVFTAAICEVTGGQPAAVCTGPAVRASQARLHVSA